VTGQRVVSEGHPRSRGVKAVGRDPLSEEATAELARAPLRACDRQVLAALLPRARHLGVPARRLAHRTEDRSPHAALRRACCRRVYLRGLFLAGGSISAGSSGYLLELRPPRGEVIRARAILASEGFAPRERVRRGRPVLALRSADAIAAFLRAAGATETLLRFETKRVAREVRGRTTALVNADAANLARAVAAARTQTVAIRALAQRGRLASLGEPLRQTARARLRAPSATLADLASRLGTTKWIVRGRLRRILAEAARE
jgi:DNA-binding protein WhiA